MSRSPLTNPANDLVSDSGAVLWSFVQGEGLEFPITLEFITDPNDGYNYEAVVIEADNIAGQDAAPEAVLNGGVQDTLTVRLPTYRGDWDQAGAYNYEDVVLYNGSYYKLLSGVARVDPTTPDADPLWVAWELNIVYVQFPTTLSVNWSVSPDINSAVYGFFELRVTETGNPIFNKTWKPIRGQVEIRFSPTEAVPDV